MKRRRICRFPIFIFALGNFLLTGIGPRASASIPTAGDFLLYVSNELSGDVSVIDPTAVTVVATFPVGKRPRGIHGTGDGALSKSR